MMMTLTREVSYNDDDNDHVPYDDDDDLDKGGVSADGKIAAVGREIQSCHKTRVSQSLESP